MITLISDQIITVLSIKSFEQVEGRTKQCPSWWRFMAKSSTNWQCALTKVTPKEVQKVLEKFLKRFSMGREDALLQIFNPLWSTVDKPQTSSFNSIRGDWWAIGKRTKWLIIISLFSIKHCSNIDWHHKQAVVPALSLWNRYLFADHPLLVLQWTPDFGIIKTLKKHFNALKDFVSLPL